jgi:hypothetical protein
VIDLGFGGVRENRLFNWLWHHGQVPYKGLSIIGTSADVTGGVRRPCERIDASVMARKLSGWGRGNANVENNHLRKEESVLDQLAGVGSTQSSTLAESMQNVAR